MSRDIFNETDSQPSPASTTGKWGVVSVVSAFVLGAAVALLLTLAAAIGGFGTYGSEQLRDWHDLAPRLGAAVSGGVAAFIGCLAGPPVGFLIANLKHSSRTAGFLAALAAMVLMPFVHGGILVVSGGLGGAVGFFAEVMLAPIPTAIATAIVPTVLGFCFGAGVADTNSTDGAGGGIEL